MASTETSLRSAGWVGLGSLGQLAIQFAFQLVLAKHFGASGDMDACVAALALPTVLASILFGSLGYAFVPVLSEQLDRGDTQQAWSTAGSMGLLLVAIAGVVAVGTFLLAGPLTAVLYPGFDGDRALRATQLLRVLCWLVLTNGLISYFQAIYHCHRRFVTPALATLVGTGLTLAIAMAYHDRGIVAIGWAILLGSVAAVMFQLPFPAAHLRCRRIEEGTVQCLRLLTPLILGAVYYRLDPLVDRYLASSLTTGSIAHLGYAWRLATALLMVGTGSLSVVAFPSFARQWAAGRQAEFRAEVAHAMRCLAVILVPILAALLCYALPLVRDLLERGRFTAADTQAVALLLVLYLGTIVGAGLAEIAAKVFYAMGDTRTPTILCSIGFTLGVMLKLLLVPVSGADGIALATSVYFLLNASAMTWLIVRRLGRGIVAGATGALRRSLLAAAAAAAAAYPIVQLGFRGASVAGAACGLAVYLIVLLVQRDEFAVKLWRFLAHRRRSA